MKTNVVNFENILVDQVAPALDWPSSITDIVAHVAVANPEIDAEKLMHRMVTAWELKHLSSYEMAQADYESMVSGKEGA
jgi:hypothetical protein